MTNFLFLKSSAGVSRTQKASLKDSGGAKEVHGTALTDENNKIT